MTPPRGPRLPAWARSIRFRLTLLYSSVLFALAALLVASLYLGLSLSVRGEPVSGGDPVVREFERRVNEHTLENLRTFSFGALGALFLASLGVGWVIAGRVLSPIARITAVANEIQASNLARRIELEGADDELKRLADTFDSMLSRLDSAFAAQRRFVADASHELRNPLAIIQSNLEVALADGSSDAASRRRAADAISRTIARMSRLTDDLLELARLEQPERRREPVDVAALLCEAADEFAAPAAARGIAITRAAADGLRVPGERELLKRALANLLDNAVRLAPEGSTVRLAAGSDGAWAWLAVADDGPGIAAGDEERVFSRFWRGDVGRARATGGSGLGLAIVRQVAERHGGRARVFSGRGQGSTFVMWLPLTDTPGEPPAVQPGAAAPSSTLPSHLRISSTRTRIASPRR